MTGGVEAPVLDGAGGVIIKEGHGLGETEETVMVVGEESWTRFGLAFWDASEPALNTGTTRWPQKAIVKLIPSEACTCLMSESQPDIQHRIAYELMAQLLLITRHYYSVLIVQWWVLACGGAVCTNLGKGRSIANRGD
jgi:hypothetical protein